MSEPKPEKFMHDPMSDKHYEEKFEFPLWQLIKKRAEEKKLSYAKAAREAAPEYIKTIRMRDTEFEDASVQARAKDAKELMAFTRKQKGL